MDTYLDFNHVLIKPTASNINSRKDVNLERTFTFNNNIKWTGIPIICANMASIGTLNMYKQLSKYNMLTCLHKFYTLQDLKNYEEEENLKIDMDYCVFSCGIRDDDINNIVEINNVYNIKWLCIDIANGYIEKFKTTCEKLRRMFPNVIIIAGNVCTNEGIYDLFDIGIDIVKCGIGSGSVCTTRLQTGVGCPQFTMLEKINDLNRNKFKNQYIMSDGGIVQIGDFSKAFGTGADFVMSGGFFSGHIENPGDIIEKVENGEVKKYKQFYGMSSDHAMRNHYGEKKKYRASEGKLVKIPLKGSVHNTIEELLGGIRSTCTYTNNNTIEGLKNIEFIRVLQTNNTIYN